MSPYLYFADTEGLKKIQAAEFSENSRKILENRYLRKDENGNIEETPEQMFDRIAEAVAEPDRPYRDVEKTRTEFYNLLSEKRVFPNSPTFTGAGTPLGQLAACFVLPIKDDLGKEAGGIFETLRAASLIQQSGGGNGFSFSELRPRGDTISTSRGRATGPVGFMSVYDVAFGEIAQGGIRRGANMGVLRVDHPDIREFIRCKSSEGCISNFNISVALTDKFMEAVKADTTYDLINPRSGKIAESPPAREIFNMIVEYAHKNGEPGVLFIDTANKQNPVPHLYDLEATNPCGEQWLGPYENCCLGSINLAKQVGEDGKLNWSKLRETVILATRFLDNAVTANRYVPSVPQLRDAALKVRRIGLGIMGLADAMYAQSIRYGSDEGQEFAAQIMEFVRFHSMKASIELARERGPFPGIGGSIYDPGNVTWEFPKPLKPFKRDWERPKLDWGEIIDGIRKYGIRNGAQTTVAPTGTVSTIAGVEGYGCEPVFALAYYRKVYQAAGNKENLTLTYISPSFEKALDTVGLAEDVKKAIVEEVIRTGSCQSIEQVPQDVRDVFVVSADIIPEEHILMQASLQAFVDNSISKTCNFPEDASREDVAKVYMMGWELGCKGLTVYVTGSRSEVVLETKETKDKKESQVIRPRLAERGYKLSGNTYKLITPQGNAFITVNKEEGGNPIEVFLNVGKAGSDVAGLSEALGRLVSGWLRASLASKDTVKEIITQLIGIGGSKSVGFGKNRVSSIPDAVAKVLAEEFDFQVRFNGSASVDNSGDSSAVAEKDSGAAFNHTDMCPECGNYTLVFEEGCAKCYDCGFSKC